MPAYIPPGSTVTQRISFNSGFVDFGTINSSTQSNRLIDVDTATISITWSTSYLYVLNSIKGAALVRHSEAVNLTATLKSFNEEFDEIAFGSMSSGTPTGIYTLDGQPSMQNPVFTFYDQNNKEYQYQVLNAVIKSVKATATQEGFTSWDVEMDALDVQLVVAP